MRKFASFFLLVLTVAGCHPGPSVEQQRQALEKGVQREWIGHSESQLVSRYGVPSSAYQLDDGSKVVSYSIKANRTTTAYTDDQGVTHYRDNSFENIWSFTINADGRITACRLRFQ